MSHPNSVILIQCVASRLCKQLPVRENHDSLLNILQSGSGWNRTMSSSAWSNVHGHGWALSDGNGVICASAFNQFWQKDSASLGGNARGNISDQIPLSCLQISQSQNQQFNKKIEFIFIYLITCVNATANSHFLWILG